MPISNDELNKIIPPLTELTTTTPQPSYFESPFVVLSIAILILGIIVLFSMTYLIKNGQEPVDILKAYGIPLIVLSSVLVAVTGFSMKELSPVIGLLGTIAGYLLGKADTNTPEPPQPPPAIQQTDDLDKTKQKPTS